MTKAPAMKASAAEEPSPRAPDIPQEGGSYVLDAASGTLRRNDPVDEGAVEGGIEPASPPLPTPSTEGGN